MTQASTSTALAWPWVLTVVLGLALFVILLSALITRARSKKARVAASQDAIWVANSAYVRSLPEFKRHLRKYRLLQLLGAASLAVALTGAAFLAAKPGKIEVSDPRMANRDIVLCLDVSGSMLEYDRALVNIFSNLVDNFEGERIALSIFNTTSRLVFPLTDDYGMVKEQLQEAYEALDPQALGNSSAALQKYEYFVAGANAELEVGYSLIGDGLASCALQFDSSAHPVLDEDEPTEEPSKGGLAPRSRSIIFATDNDLQGSPIYSLQEAADLALELDVSLIGLYGSGSTNLAGEEEFRDVFTKAKGMYFYSDDASMIDAIVADIQSRQAVQHDAAPVITRTNIAGPWFAVLVLGLIGFLVVQRRLSE